jgi:hypothetical protein
MATIACSAWQPVVRAASDSAATVLGARHSAAAEPPHRWQRHERASARGAKHERRCAESDQPRVARRAQCGTRLHAHRNMHGRRTHLPPLHAEPDGHDQHGQRRRDDHTRPPHRHWYRPLLVVVVRMVPDRARRALLAGGSKALSTARDGLGEGAGPVVAQESPPQSRGAWRQSPPQSRGAWRQISECVDNRSILHEQRHYLCSHRIWACKRSPNTLQL